MMWTEEEIEVQVALRARTLMLFASRRREPMTEEDARKEARQRVKESQQFRMRLRTIGQVQEPT